MNSFGKTEVISPRKIYLLASLGYLGVLYAAAILIQHNNSFWTYCLLVGFLGGFFSGLAYQAPLLACQIHFPDRKQMISRLFLFGLAVGIAVYSYLTSVWFSRESDPKNIANCLINLAYCMSGHVFIAFLLMLDPAILVSKDDLRVLKLNLLNAETLEDDPHSAMQIR